MRALSYLIFAALLSCSAAPARAATIGAPAGGLIDGGDGLYGVVQGPLLTGGGAIFHIGYDGAGYREIRHFAREEGRPNEAIAFGVDGKIYGEAGSRGSVLFSMDRDGSDYRELYVFPKDEFQVLGPVPIGAAVLAASLDENGDVAIYRIAHGARAVVGRFGGHPSLRQLKRIGDKAYGVVQFRCSTEVFSLDAGGITRIAGSADKSTCGSGPYFIDIQIVAGEFFALENSAIDRIVDGRPVTVYVANETLQPTLSLGSDGAFYVRGVRSATSAFLTGTPLTDCGDVVRVSTAGDARKLYAYPARPVCADPSIGPYPTVATHEGIVYGLTPPELNCGNSNALIAEEDRACGNIFAIAPDGFRILHAFEAAPSSLDGITPTTTFALSDVPGVFALTRVYYAKKPIVLAPPSQPASLIDEATGERHALEMLGIGDVALPERPDERGPGLRYRIPQLSAGMYRVDGAGVYRRFYFPANYAFERSPATNPEVAPLPELSRFSRIAHDADAEAAMKNLAGKIVNAETTIGGQCVRANGKEFGLVLRGGARVAQIFRVSGSADLALARSGDATAFTAVDPLVVTFEMPLHGSAAFAGGDASAVSLDPTACRAFYTIVADRWQLERELSAAPRVDPAWPKAFRDAVARGTVIPGMTHAMVAAAIGYPTRYGTIEELDKLDVWSYDDAAPFGSTVHFARGVVTTYEPPGRLP